MIRGAAIAPSRPNSPDAVSTRPICTGANPSSMRRRMATKMIALISRLTEAE